jgi:SAM-dependent methyltransferase
MGLADVLTRNYPANYDAHARTVAEDAYWQQVRRTINGKPVAESQILLIVDAIFNGLSLAEMDVVLDLACGNGALSSYLFDKCAGLVGVDISPYLIDIAKQGFARPPDFCFCADHVMSYLAGERDTARFTKALIYAGLQYLSRDDAVTVLNALNQRFPRISKVFIGNIPDKRYANKFFGTPPPAEAELNDHEARIGVWYLPEEIAALARSTGWRASFSYMPADFYLANHRFDVTLERAGS